MGSNLTNPIDPDSKGRKGRNGRRGHANFNETLAFVTDFPTDKMPHVISATKFDLWAFRHGFYLNSDGSVVDKTATDTLNRVRNTLRNQINNTASGDPWINAGYTPFHVYVLAQGQYKMTDVNEAFQHKTETMPGQIKSFASAKETAINELYSALDLKALTAEERLKIGSYKRSLGTFKRILDVTMEEYANELRELVAHQKRLANPKRRS